MKLYTIAIDKLHLQLVGEILEVEEKKKRNGSIDFKDVNFLLSENDILIKRYKSKISDFFSSFEVYYKAKLIGVLHYQNKGRKRFSVKGVSVFEVENALLYQIEFGFTLKKVLLILGLGIHKLQKIEIAIDGAGIFKTAHQLLITDKWVTANHKYELGVNPKSLKNYRSKGIQLGVDDGKKTIVIYPKSHKISDKPYIQDFWQQNGLDISKPIERCELSLRGNLYQFRLDPLQWTADYLIGFFIKHARHNLTFRNKKSGSIKELLDFDKGFGKIKIQNLSFTKRLVSHGTSIKTTLKTLFLEAERNGDEVCYEAYRILTKRYRMSDYTKKMEPKWTRL